MPTAAVTMKKSATPTRGMAHSGSHRASGNDSAAMMTMAIRLSM